MVNYDMKHAREAQPIVALKVAEACKKNNLLIKA